MSTQTVHPPLSQGVGYGVIIGLGIVFAVLVVSINSVSKRLSSTITIDRKATEYAVASRSLGIGLTASAAVSAWCWSVTLLSSCTTAYQHGVAGALFYGVGNMVQIAIFSLFAIQLKRIAPHVHTHLEMIYKRYGRASHLTLLFFALVTNLLVSSSILIGSSAAVHSITGTSTYAVLFLLPFAVLMYTLHGGLRATILADYMHTTVILVITLLFFARTYLDSSGPVGSPQEMYRLLTLKSKLAPSDNYKGSYLTVRSLGSIKFAWLSVIEYTATFVNDASSHQKGVAARPNAAVPGYLIGSLAWFAIPWTLATTAGLAALALETESNRFPTFPRRMTEEEVSAGLVLPYAAQALLGKAGSVCVLLLMFMSSTSAISSQMIAVATISGYDLYGTYFCQENQQENIQRRLLRVQQIVVSLFAVIIAAFASILHLVNVDLGFLFNTTGLASVCTLPAITFAFFCRRLPTWCLLGIWLVLCAGLAVWFGLSVRLDGAISLRSLENIDVDLYTYSTSIASGALLCVLGCLFGAKVDQKDFLNLTVKTQKDQVAVDRVRWATGMSDDKLLRWLRVAILGVALIIAVFMLIWPLSLYRNFVFTEEFFVGWIIVSGLWALASLMAVVVWPIIEGTFIVRNSFLKGRFIDHEMP